MIFIYRLHDSQSVGQVDLSDSWSVRIDVDNVFDGEFYTSYADVWVEPGA